MNLMATLSSRSVYRSLLLLNVLTMILVAWIFRDTHGNDKTTYFSLADGLMHGNYSMWWFLPFEVPDTFRNPGYPLFLVPFRYFTQAMWPIQIAQFALVLGSVILILRTLERSGGGLVAKNVFLLLLLPSINIAYYITGIYAETLTMFLVCWFIWVEVAWRPGWKRSLTMGLLLGAAFQCRSALLLFPLLWLAVRIVQDGRRTAWLQAFVLIGTFACTTIPFGLWNLRHHGVFKITSLEGGGGVLHMGWWSGKVPGHMEKWYWGNVASAELVRFCDPEDVAVNVTAFDAEWRGIDSTLASLLNTTDTKMLAAFSEHPEIFRTYNSAYTLRREELLKEVTIAHMLDEPGYTVAYKTWSAARLWVTGIDPGRVKAAGPAGKAAAIYPFALTLSMMLLAFIVVPIALWRDRALLRLTTPLLLWLVYFGAIHIPFVIQARYTIPVRLALMAVIALCVAYRMQGKNSTT